MPRLLTIFVAAALLGGCASGPAGGDASRPDHAITFEDVPASWCAEEYRMEPDDEGKRTLTLVAPDGDANVIASSEPIGHRYGTREYADSQELLLRDEFPGFEELDFGPSSAYRDGVIREFSWNREDGVKVWQVQAYRATNGVGYTATGTTTFDAPADVREELRELIEGVRFVTPKDAVEPPSCDEATTS